MSANLAQNMFALGYPCPLDLIDNVSWQALASQTGRRLSRGSSNSTRGSSPMKVTKPSSTNNSPRRRTTTSPLAMRRQQTMETVTMPAPAATTPLDTTLDYPQRTTSRPLSWHPSSFNQPMQYQQQQPTQYGQLSQYPFPSSDAMNLYAPLPSYSPAQTAYSSCNGSPSSFSPMVLPSGGFDMPSYMDVGSWDMAQGSMPSYLAGPLDNSAYPESFPMMPGCAADNTPLLDGLEWNLFAMQGFSVDAPPTPGMLPQEPQPNLLPEDDAEDDGEILVGMGLYDESDKLIDDPQLDHARSSMSMLMGSMPTGKGLKLEETWQPPETEDVDEDDEE